MNGRGLTHMNTQFALGGTVNVGGTTTSFVPSAGFPLSDGLPVVVNGGSMSVNVGSAYVPLSITVVGDAAVGAWAAGSAYDNLTIDPMNQATGSPITLATNLNNVPSYVFGNLTLNGPATFATVGNGGDNLYLQGGILTGLGFPTNSAFNKAGVNQFIIAGNSPAYNGPVTVEMGTLASWNGSMTAGTPFGTGSITVDPGTMLRLASPMNVSQNSAVTISSDLGGVAGLGLAYNDAVPGNVKFQSNGFAESRASSAST